MHILESKTYFPTLRTHTLSMVGFKIQEIIARMKKLINVSTYVSTYTHH